MHFDGVPWRNKSPIPQALGTACIYYRSTLALAILQWNLSGAYRDTPVNPGRLCHCIHKLPLPFRLPNRAIGCTSLLNPYNWIVPPPVIGLARMWHAHRLSRRLCPADPV
jgi:hypothetical protein